jgi:four helix bundle protein
MRNFEQLKVWQRSHRLTLAVYDATTALPKEELYGLTSQMRRSCAAIPANIAEGCGRSSNADLARFLQIALGSASELQYHLLLARDLSYLNPRTYKRLTREATETKRMLTSFIKNLRAFAKQT